MDWIRENKVLATILGVIAAGSIGLGYLLFDAWGAYSAARDEYTALGGNIAQIKGLALAPTEQNLKAKKALVDEYAANVSKLGGALLFLQPVPVPSKQAEFQTKLKDRVVQIKNLAQSLKVSLPPDFGLGFTEYLGALPTSDAVATELSAYLDGVEAIVKLALNSNVKSIDLLERAQLPNEQQASARPVQPARTQAGMPGQGRPAASAPASIVEKRNVSIVMTLDQPALQLIMSRLANPTDMKVRPDADQSFFTSLRILRVENQAKEGPVRQESVAAMQQGGVGGGESPSPDGSPAVNSGASTTLAPPLPAAADSVPVIGQELLKAQMEIDLVKFSDAVRVSTAP